MWWVFLQRKTLQLQMSVYLLNPLQDSRWPEFLKRHPRASIFHTPGWLEVLRRTYGYEPVVYTTAPRTAELTNGLVFCRINSWLTGRRMVSLPFSDHCEPLVEPSEGLQLLLAELRRVADREGLNYVEIRPLDCDPKALTHGTGFHTAKSYCFHKLDLRVELDKLFRGFHKSSIQRKIRRAEREALTYEDGRSEFLLHKFYHLLLLTRRRQRLPPHPIGWFRNLIDCLGDKLKIRVASKNGQSIASILTLSFKDSLVYKYGCSDVRFNNLGGMAFLFWKSIQEGINNELREFDMGRSDCDNPGLITFKDRWGTARSMLTYSRYPAPLSPTFRGRWKMEIAKQIFAHAPDGFLTTAGKLLYRHIG